MKVILFVALLALSYAAPIEFAKDSHEESPISFFTKGFFDPTVSGESKIESFIRLANELIPLAEVKGEVAKPAGQKLGYAYVFCTGADGQLFNACFNIDIQMWLGWSSLQNCQGCEDCSTVVPTAYNATITPFAFLRAGANVTVESYPAEVGYGAYLSIVDIQIPISFQFGQTNLCWSGGFYFMPGAFYTQISTALLECGWCFTPYCFEGCNKVSGPNFQHLTYALWQGYTNSFLPYSCQALPF